MKNTGVISICIIALLLCLCINITTYTRISDKFYAVQSKLTELDGRRNAQYGIIKNKLEQCGEHQ